MDGERDRRPEKIDVSRTLQPDLVLVLVLVLVLLLLLLLGRTRPGTRGSGGSERGWRVYFLDCTVLYCVCAFLLGGVIVCMGLID